jgi:ribosomal protein S18 acetylase RimI-like enzyme
MYLSIKNLTPDYFNIAVEIFTKAFVNDPLHIFAFPDDKERERITKLVYELVILSIVPEMELKIKGAFADGIPAGAIIYTIPESNTEWNNKLDFAVSEMRRKAGNEKIRLIGEYAMTSGKYRPKFPHFYLNELAVMPEMQGKSIGTKLMQSVEPECIEHPMALGTGLDTTNKRNVNLYKRLGYETVSTFDFYGLRCYSMFKKLK